MLDEYRIELVWGKPIKDQFFRHDKKGVWIFFYDDGDGLALGVPKSNLKQLFVNNKEVRV